MHARVCNARYFACGQPRVYVHVPSMHSFGNRDCGTLIGASLQNLGNTCIANSMVQSIYFYTPSLCNIISSSAVGPGE